MKDKKRLFKSITKLPCYIEIKYHNLCFLLFRNMWQTNVVTVWQGVTLLNDTSSKIPLNLVVKTLITSSKITLSETWSKVKIYLFPLLNLDKKWHRKFLSLLVVVEVTNFQWSTTDCLINFWYTRQWFLMKWSFPNSLDWFLWIKSICT